jgi:hypothetical protein
MAEILLEPSDEELEHVIIIHDESTVHSNEYQNNHAGPLCGGWVESCQANRVV